MDIIVPHDTSQVNVVPSTPGIYAIVNMSNSNFYVGSSVDLLRRKSDHLSALRTGKHVNSHLQRAYDLYGPDKFCFVVIDLVKHVEDLLSVEQRYIDGLNPQYNIARVAGSTLGMERTPEYLAKLRVSVSKATEAARIANTGQHRSPETRAKLSAAKRGKSTGKQSPELVEKRAASLRGRKLTPEQRAKLSAANTGKKLTTEHKAKMSAAKRGKPGKNRSPEAIAKTAAFHRGRKLAPEHVAKLSASHLGKTRTPESIAKQKATRLANKLAKQQADQPPLF